MSSGEREAIDEWAARVDKLLEGEDEPGGAQQMHDTLHSSYDDTIEETNYSTDAHPGFYNGALLIGGPGDGRLIVGAAPAGQAMVPVITRRGAPRPFVYERIGMVSIGDDILCAAFIPAQRQPYFDDIEASDYSGLS